MNQEKFNDRLKRSTSSSSTLTSLTSRYLACLALAPGVVRLIGDGKLEKVGKEGGAGGDQVEGGVHVRSASDFSYSAPSYAGNGYRIVGDAGGSFSLFILLLSCCHLIPISNNQSIYSLSVHRSIFLLWDPPSPNLGSKCRKYNLRSPTGRLWGEGSC
jgi:hypothetical protein